MNAPDCASESGSFCQWIWNETGAEWLAARADRFVGTLISIVLILVIAWLVRFLLFRSIDRLTALTAGGQTPRMLRPLKATARKALPNGLSAERRRQRALAMGSLLKSITSFTVLAVVVIMILAEIGVDVAPLLASAGIVGVALAFGAQNLIKDFLAGIFMTLEDQYGVGDTVDLGSASGTVTTVGLRTTTLRAGDGTVWHVRNGEVLRVGNASQGEAVVSIDIPLPYDADTARAGAVALAAAESVAGAPDFAETVAEQPKLQGIVDVAPGVITIRLAATVRAGDEHSFAPAVLAAIKAAFDAELRRDPRADFRPPVIPAAPEEPL